MSQPVGGPATLEAVKHQLQLRVGDSQHDDQLNGILGAVNIRVRRMRVAQLDAESWPEDIALGAVMLAARLFKRRDTPAGVSVFGDNAALYVSRNDPDIAMLLQLGPYSRPAVG